MPKCSFCKREILPGRGIIFVDVSGKPLYFCSSKCKRNWRLGRKPGKLAWIRKKKKVKKG